MLKRWSERSDELLLAEALVYIVLIGSLAFAAAIAVHFV